ncbi:MAG: SDR family oxidoreductase [Arenicellales bacterium]
MTRSPSILITGASGGIGRAAAVRCASKGARIGIHYNGNKHAAERLREELPAAGHRVYQCDISDPRAVERLIGQADEEFGGLDVLVNNAGVYQRHAFDDIDYQTWQNARRSVMETNLIGAANLSFCASRAMIQRGGGRIVNVSSRGAFRGEPEAPWYGASKAGMNAMAQSMAQALGPKGVFIFTVAPGFVETEMAREVLDSPEGDAVRNQSTMGRVARPEEVANAICYLALEAPEFMTGCIIDVNGASYLRS